MSLWKCLQNNIHDDMDGVAILLLPAGCVPITQAEADALRAPPPPTPQQQRDVIQYQIDKIEADTHMNRFVREAMILISQQQAAALGLTEPQLYEANIGYKKVKDIDTMIVDLRTQMEAIV